MVNPLLPIPCMHALPHLNRPPSILTMPLRLSENTDRHVRPVRPVYFCQAGLWCSGVVPFLVLRSPCSHT